MAGDVAGFVRGEKDNRPSYLLGLAEAAHRGAPDDCPLEFLPLSDGRRHLCFDVCRGDGVDAHSRWRPLDCHGSRQFVEGSLAGVVGRQQRQGALGSNRRYVDDRATPTPEHPRRKHAQQIECSVQVDPQDLRKLLALDFLSRFDDGTDACVVNQDVRCTIPSQFFDQGLDTFRIADVADEGGPCPSGLMDSGDSRFQLLACAAYHGYFGTTTGQGDGRGAADTAPPPP